MIPIIFQTFHNRIKGEDIPLHVDEFLMTMQQTCVLPCNDVQFCGCSHPKFQLMIVGSKFGIMSFNC